MKFYPLLTMTAVISVSGVAHAEQKPAYDAELEQILSTDIADLVVTSASKREQ